MSAGIFSPGVLEGFGSMIHKKFSGRSEEPEAEAPEEPKAEEPKAEAPKPKWEQFWFLPEELKYRTEIAYWKRFLNANDPGARETASVDTHLLTGLLRLAILRAEKEAGDP